MIICNICGKEKTYDEMVKDKGKKAGIRSVCKKCENLKKRKTPVSPIPKDGFKYCAKCKMEFPIENFNTRKINGNFELFSWCKECEHIYNNSRYSHTCSECGKKYQSGKKGSMICKDCDIKRLIKIGTETLKKHNKSQSGKNNYFYGSCRKGKENPNYNPNKTDEEREKGRIIDGYKEWKDKVYSRDKYTCQICGDNKGGNLVAHHLDGYNWAKDKRICINNGITLCEKCHKEFHNEYEYRNNTKEQFYQFKDNKLIPR